MLHSNRCILILFLAGGAALGLASGECSLPSSESLPGIRQGLSRGGSNDALPPRRWIFAIGVGFERVGTTLGVPLSQVLPGSPADRAGLAAGAIIAEINGVSTVGRTDEECVRMVKDGGASVKLKFYDPATLLPRTLTLKKESIALPN
jgi:predicted metalloprotease with PDZ domain